MSLLPDTVQPYYSLVFLMKSLKQRTQVRLAEVPLISFFLFVKPSVKLQVALILPSNKKWIAIDQCLNKCDKRVLEFSICGGSQVIADIAKILRRSARSAAHGATGQRRITRGVAKAVGSGPTGTTWLADWDGHQITSDESEYENIWKIYENIWKYGSFLKLGVSPNHPCIWIFHYKPSSYIGDSPFMKPPIKIYVPFNPSKIWKKIW